MSKLYLILGSTGAYDDWHQWPVKGFTDKDKAEEYLELCQESADRVFAMVEWQRRLDQKVRPPTKWGIDKYVNLHFQYHDLVKEEDRLRVEQLKNAGNDEDADRLWEELHEQAKADLLSAMPYDENFHIDAAEWHGKMHATAYEMVEVDLDPEFPVDNEVELEIPAEPEWYNIDDEESS